MNNNDCSKKACFFLLSFAFFVVAGIVQSPAQTLMTRHVREATVNGQAAQLGRLPATQIMQLDVVLPVRDQAGLDAFLEQLYTTDSNQRHYVTPAEFTERFGPTQRDYDAVVEYLRAHGLEVVGGSRDGMETQARGPVSAVEAAFHVNMLTYQHPTENRIFYAPDREPTTELPFALWHISGLDNFSIPHPKYVNRFDYAKTHGLDPDSLITHAKTGSGPSNSFLGSDMRAAYYGGTALTGAGQNLGLLEYVGTDLDDLEHYYSGAHETLTVPITVLSTDGTSTSCFAKDGCDDTEQTLDMTQSLGMAPRLASLVMYVGSTDTAMVSAMTTHNPLPTTIGCSWGWTPPDKSTLDPYFQKMSAQGQNFFVASGDDSTWTQTGNGEAWPADSEGVVAVGGTDLTTASAGGPWKAETIWGDSGGGISPDNIPIPDWQKFPGVINARNMGSHTLRNGPDVSANANFTFYTCADQQECLANVYGGTSFAAPMWAGYVALANEERANNGNPTLGFIDRDLYSFGISSSYDADFHDIIGGHSGKYKAVKGYDLVTGWGTPNGQGLIDALAGEK